ncbi:hypothetical protein [Halalkalibacter akibai]|nr:hypothetical protein [Halalkalibacter akibai]
MGNNGFSSRVNDRHCDDVCNTKYESEKIETDKIGGEKMHKELQVK